MFTWVLWYTLTNVHFSALAFTCVKCGLKMHLKSVAISFLKHSQSIKFELFFGLCEGKAEGNLPFVYETGYLCTIL